MGFLAETEKQIKLASQLGSFLRLLPPSRAFVSYLEADRDSEVIDPALNTYTYHAAMILLATFFQPPPPCFVHRYKTGGARQTVKRVNLYWLWKPGECSSCVPLALTGQTLLEGNKKRDSRSFHPFQRVLIYFTDHPSTPRL